MHLNHSVYPESLRHQELCRQHTATVTQNAAKGLDTKMFESPKLK